MPNNHFRHSRPSGRDKRGPGQPDLFDATPTYRDDVQKFITHWNELVWLPPILGTDRQAHEIREAFRRPFFKNNWQQAIKTLIDCKWLRLKKKPAFRIDFFLEADNFDKIMEGFYTDKDEDKQTGPHKATTNDAGEEIIE